MDHFYSHHVLHSLSLSMVHKFKAKDRVLDIGTGGGFPGLPLAILFPECQFVLTDSIGKKIKVVNEVSKALNINNVETINSRVEVLSENFDILVSRAVAPATTLVQYTYQCINEQSSYLFLKGGNLMAERTELLQSYAQAHWQEYLVSERIDDPFFESKKIVKITHAGK